MVSGVSTLWIDPVWEGSASISSTDGTAASTVSEICFRQETGEGTVLVDNLRVGASFVSVLPVTSIPLTATRSGSNLIMNWNSPVFALATGTSANQVTNRVSATSSYTNSMSGPMRFYRLIWP